MEQVNKNRKLSILVIWVCTFADTVEGDLGRHSSYVARGTKRPLVALSWLPKAWDFGFFIYSSSCCFFKQTELVFYMVFSTKLRCSDPKHQKPMISGWLVDVPRAAVPLLLEDRSLNLLQQLVLGSGGQDFQEQDPPNNGGLSPKLAALFEKHLGFMANFVGIDRTAWFVAFFHDRNLEP